MARIALAVHSAVVTSGYGAMQCLLEQLMLVIVMTRQNRRINYPGALYLIHSIRATAL